MKPPSYVGSGLYVSPAVYGGRPRPRRRWLVRIVAVLLALFFAATIVAAGFVYGITTGPVPGPVVTPATYDPPE